VTSPAFAGPLHGTVDRIGMKIGKQDALGTDPAARINARVVEVEICLDESEAAAGYTNLQVEIVFEG
jgi:HlyD family secretion protein